MKRMRRQRSGDVDNMLTSFSFLIFKHEKYVLNIDRIERLKKLKGMRMTGSFLPVHQ